VNGYLYVNDSLELARRGEDTTLEEATAAVASYAEDARTKQEAVTEAHALTATMNQARACLQSQLDNNRAEVDRFRKDKTEGALTNYATTDHAANAEAYARMTRDISWLTLSLATCDTVTMPARILSQWRAESVLLRAMGNLFTSRAIEASVERHAAAKALLETDGVVTLGASGRAHDLLMQALNWHRRASESDRAIFAEEQRRSLIAASEKGTL
jgi:hypothetical protein